MTLRPQTPPRLTPFAVSYAVIVATLVLMFSLGMSTLSGVRGFVSGESSWSKAQKQATACIQRFAVTHDEDDYACYRHHRELLISARKARVELEKKDPDLQAAYRYLVGADGDPDDAPAMAAVFRRFSNNALMRNVIAIWIEGDLEVARMDSLSEEIRDQVARGYTHDNAALATPLRELRANDARLTVLENGFSDGLGVSARYIGKMMLTIVVLAGLLLLALAVFLSSRWIKAWRVAQSLAGERAARMHAVAGAAAGVGSVATLEELDHVLHVAIDKVIDLDALTFGSYDDATRSFTFLPGMADGIDVPARTVSIEGTPSERFLSDRTPLLTNSSADRAGRGASQYGSAKVSESVIRCPMYSGTRLIGIISVHSYTPHRYTIDDVEVVETLASVAATAIERIENTRERLRAEESLRQSKERLAQAHKMEAVGLLAGGVAHDFNNLLTAIKGNSDLLATDPALPDELRDHVSEIAAASERAAALTSQLLAFSRRQVLQPRVVDLNDLVAHMTKLIRRLIGADVELRTSMGADLGHVRADPHQMEQVILNLMLNGRDAISGNGSLTIETCNVELTDPILNMPSIKAGSYVLLSVKDSGIGISEEDRARIFEPFFTTKGVGKGTGLGLSTVYGIVKQSGGYIYVQSAPGRGTTMQIFLPRTDDALDPPLADTVEQPRAVSIERATILVVEDESTVRTLLSRVLSRAGYTVVEAGTGEEAVAILSAGIEVDLLLTDTVMPGMSGVTLAERALEMRPALAILHMSGYTEDEVFRRGLSRRGEAFLQKPFTPAVLLNGVADALTRKGTAV